MDRAPTTSPPVTGPEAEAPRRASAADEVSAHEVWDQLAGPLGDADLRLRSLRSRFSPDSPEARELDEAISSVERAFGAAMRAPHGTVS